MKTKIFLLLTAILLSVGIEAQAKKKDNQKETVEFEVSMTCHSCQKKIERNIPFEKGVTDLKVDLDKKTVLIEYRKDKTTQEKLQEAFEKMGYTAIAISPETNTEEKTEEAK